MKLGILLFILLTSAAQSQAATVSFIAYMCGVGDGTLINNGKARVFDAEARIFGKSAPADARAKRLASNAAINYCRRQSQHPKACDRPYCVRFRDTVEVGSDDGSSGDSSSAGMSSGGGSSRSGSSSGSSSASEKGIVFKKCDRDSDCQGFANHCFAGKCSQPGFGCASDSDCPGFANHCFASKCTRQEPLCASDADCHGFANHCFAGKCTNP